MPDGQVTLDRRREGERQKYLRLAPRGYGGSNHGRDAYAIVLTWRPRPRFVVDFGCGRNDFIRELRRRGVDGLGIDWANDLADVVAPMHCVPLAGGIADVVTSFDAVEHLLPEDVDPALAEMRRVGQPGGRFILSTCTRPSRITLDGENLHPTVRPITRWVERISRVGTIESVGRYLSGTWNA